MITKTHLAIKSSTYSGAASPASSGGRVVTHLIIIRHQRRCLSTRRPAKAEVFEFEGQKYRAALGRFPDGTPAEIFIDAVGKAGSAIQQHVETAAILASILMQHGIPLDQIRHSISGPVEVALGLFSTTEEK
jgi:hypothetical protein